MRTILAVFLVLACCAGAVKADDAIGVITYDVSFPLGDMKNYVDKEELARIRARGKMACETQYFARACVALEHFLRDDR